MLRFTLIVIFSLLSLLAILPTPSHYTWYLTILITEFPWIFLTIMGVLLIVSFGAERYKAVSLTLCIVSFCFYAYSTIGAFILGIGIDGRITNAFGPHSDSLSGIHQKTPFGIGRMLNPISPVKVPYTTYHYATHTGVDLTLDYYPSQLPGGQHPCIVVAHGGSWKSGNSQELPDIDWYLARQGYNVASINYRLAPQFKSPSPIEDMAAALAYLKANAALLKVDTANFVLLGRSAGGHIVLQAAYTLNDPDIKGVVDLYGPTDMPWAYNHPDNPLVMHSCQVLTDYLGSADTASAAFHDASPINFVTARTPATLIIHGGNDAHVNYELSDMLDKKLQQYNVKHLLLGIPWGTHGCEFSLKSPSGQLYKYTVERFVHSVVGK